MDAEYTEGTVVDIKWMRQAFQYAKQNNSKAIMIPIQANPWFENTWPTRQKGVAWHCAGTEEAQQLH